MTDREKMIELMTDLYGGDPLHYGVKAHHIADHLIANGVTFATGTDVPSKWISVGDRLPVDEKPILAYYGFDHDGSGNLKIRFMGTLSYFVFDPRPNWQHAELGLVVTHWMPLPEPPVGNPSVSLEADSSLCTREPLSADI